VVVSGVDEDTVPTDEPAAMVLTLAELKARAVASAVTDRSALVLGADSTLVLDGRTLGKPGSAAAATLRWQEMRGRHGSLLTGHFVIDTDSGKSAAEVGRTEVYFGTPSDAEIAAYVASGEPIEVAGAFTLDGRGAPFVDRIEGDHSNVVGLSLPVVRRLLAELGVGITDLWQ
jgi:septum formation protein